MIWTTFVARAARCSVQRCSVGAWDNLPPLSVNTCLDLRVLLDLRALPRALLPLVVAWNAYDVCGAYKAEVRPSSGRAAPATAAPSTTCASDDFARPRPIWAGMLNIFDLFLTIDGFHSSWCRCWIGMYKMTS